jgi:hexosaminidase
MWNDDALRSTDTGWKRVVELNKNIDIWFWTTGANTVKDYIDAGYEVYNILCDYNYYALTFNYFSGNRELFVKASPEVIYTEWNPYIFDPNNADPAAVTNTSAGNPAVLGSSFAIWCDHPDLKTEAEVMAEVLPMLRAHAVKAWDADYNLTHSYAEFEQLVQKSGNAPDASGKLPPVPAPEPVTEIPQTAAAEPPEKDSGSSRTGRLFIKA